MNTTKGLNQQADELIAYGWTIIANVSEGAWEQQTTDWQEAAKRWRSQYHKWLDDHGYPRTAEEEEIHDE